MNKPIYNVGDRVLIRGRVIAYSHETDLRDPKHTSSVYKLVLSNSDYEVGGFNPHDITSVAELHQRSEDSIVEKIVRFAKTHAYDGGGFAVLIDEIATREWKK